MIYELFMITTALNGVCAILYFTQGKLLLGGIWAINAILWGISTYFHYEIYKKEEEEK